jgi:heme/copper-type cytochrome/quinol oxidase subunit 2
VNLFVQVAIIVAVSAIFVGLLWLHRRSPWNERFSSQLGEHERAFEFLGVAFAVLLAFVVLEAYDIYNDAKSGAEQ